MREIVHLQCQDCKRKNYSTTKNKRTTTAKLEFNKFCRSCGGVKVHREAKA